MFILICLVALAASLYWFVEKTYSYWPKKGAKQLKPFPIFGNTLRTFFRKQSMAELTKEVYDSAPDQRYVGMYHFVLPVLILRDPELIKEIAVKEFDTFSDHRTVIPPENDNFWGNSLFTLKGATWHNMRSTLSPAYSNSRMRNMYSLMTDSAKKVVQYFMEKDENISEIEMKDLASRYCNDVIVSTAFGVKVDSLKQPDNEFYKMGVAATDFSSPMKTFKIFSFIVFPFLTQLMNIRFFPKHVRLFFQNLVKEAQEIREGHQSGKPDLMGILLQNEGRDMRYKKINGEVVKDDKQDIMDTSLMSSQALIFFFAAFDVTSSQMCFMSYELAVNPDIQDRLRKEMEDLQAEYEGEEVPYDALMKLPYLDMVIFESLRKWPIGPVVDRVCTRPYTIQPKNPREKPIHLNKGDIVWLPYFALHRDPNNFPDPEKFDPERFSEENKHKIKPYTFNPFGVGPRICIGNRFAQVEIKVFFFHLLMNFEIVPVKQTPMPLIISRRTFGLHAEVGFYLGLKKRVKA